MDAVSAHNSLEEFCCKEKEKSRALAGGESGVKTRGNSWHIWEVTEIIQL